MRKAEADEEQRAQHKARAKPLTASQIPPGAHVATADCCSCRVEAQCARVLIASGRWYWICGECARKISSTWAAAARGLRAEAQP